MSSSSDNPAPPPGVRPHLQTAGNPPASANVPVRAALWTGWAAAACTGLTTAYFGANYFTARSEALLLHNEVELARTEAQSLAQRLEAEHILTSTYIAQLQKSGDLAHVKIAKLTAPSDAAQPPMATALWNPLSQQGLLWMEKLPPLPADQDYQLWLGDSTRPDPINAGIVSIDANGTARFVFRPEQPTTTATTLTLRRERKGGAPKPEGSVVAAGTL